MKYVLILASLLMAGFVYGAEPVEEKSLGESLQRGAEKVSNEMIEAYRNTSEAALNSRQNHSATLLLSYSPLDLIMPSKLGANVAWHSSADVLYEIDYSSSSVKVSVASVDLSKVSETRTSLLKRKFNGGAFNWYWGVHYNSLSARVDPRVMATADAGTSDLINVQTLGLSIGVGHRWVFKDNFSVGVDWFSWAQPLFTLKRDAVFLNATNDSNYRDDMDTALKIMGYFPRWAAFKVYLGYSF